MLKPISAPLPCFAIEHNPKSQMCQECPHNADCRDFTGYRLNRVTLDAAQFDFIPKLLAYKKAAWEVDEENVEATYAEAYRQVFACDPKDSVGKFKGAVLALAKRIDCSVSMFMVTCMFAHAQSSSEQFTAGILADGRALNRVQSYAEACRKTYASFTIHSLSALTKMDMSTFDLSRRMLESETKAGSWIIQYKIENAGLPYPAIFEALEAELDPNWLAIENHYLEILMDYSRRKDVPGDEETRHMALTTFARLKKHKHQGISSFRARERIMTQAIRNVLGTIYYEMDDFEIENKPITDPLKFWHRLGQAVQHMECLKFVRLGEGVFAR